jgi:two-component system response regulator FlrC
MEPVMSQSASAVSQSTQPPAALAEAFEACNQLAVELERVYRALEAQFARLNTELAQHGGDTVVEPARPDISVMVRHAVQPQTLPDEVAPVAVAASSCKLLALARRVAASPANVLILGPSGTGKEVIAHEIHRCSPRAQGPFVAVNCAAIPDNMLEALLFGYEKGAYTGAHQASTGKFEQAQGGTLLLDEISEMTPALQAKLLRVLQEREVERLGGRKPIALDVRVIATSNRDLKAEVAAGRFREDLYYRLNVFPLTLAPLGARHDDILPLARALIARHAPQPAPDLSAAARAALLAHDWPGNVRELDNVIQRALILSGGRHIETVHLVFDSTVPDENVGEILCASVRMREGELIEAALAACGGRRDLAAQKLGISARTLRYKLARLREVPRVSRQTESRVVA